MSDRNAGLAAPSSALPLALTLGLHLLLVLAWRAHHSPLPAPGDRSELETLLVPVLAPRPRIVPPPPAPRPRAASAPAAATARAPILTAPRPEPEPVAEAADADPFAAANPAPPSMIADSELLGRAKRAAGSIDRTLRGGQSGVPKDPDTPWGRFQRGLAAAYVDRSTAVINDRYTAADGITIYRSRQGQRETCRITGSVGFATGGFGGTNAAGAVPCPRGVTWERY